MWLKLFEGFRGNFITAILINIVFTVFAIGGDFGNLEWGMTQSDVIALNGKPVEKTENRLIYGTLTQTFAYRDDGKKHGYDLLFLENLLTNVSYKISTHDGLPANEVSHEFNELTKLLDETYQDPPLVEKMDNSTKKIVYNDGKTRVIVVYLNIPIKGDYVNRTSYLNVTYSNSDPVFKAKIKNRKRYRIRGIQ